VQAVEQIERQRHRDQADQHRQAQEDGHGAMRSSKLIDDD
jgi:hypothetical protein